MGVRVSILRGDVGRDHSINYTRESHEPVVKFLDSGSHTEYTNGEDREGRAMPWRAPGSLTGEEPGKRGRVVGAAGMKYVSLVLRIKTGEVPQDGDLQRVHEKCHKQEAILYIGKAQ